MSYCTKCGADTGDGNNFCGSCGTDLYTPAPPEEPKKKSRRTVIAVAAVVAIILIAAAGFFYYVEEKNSAEVTINVYPQYTVTDVTIFINGNHVSSYIGVVYDWEYVYYTEKIKFSSSENNKVLTIKAVSGYSSDTKILYVEKCGKYTVDLYI
jgi:hypothetical protein